MKDQNLSERSGTRLSSLAVFLLVLAVLMYGILGLKLSAHLPLIAATAVVTLYGRFYLKISLKELEQTVSTAAKGVPFLILLTIGMLIASWILSGTVPYLVFLGLRFLNPKWFLALVVVLCAALAAVTGSSWTTCATLGVAFLAISISMGIPPGMTVGAVVCGAFFGEKQSPVSDFTVFAAGMSRVELMHHLKYMLFTSAPALAISVLAFLVLGFRYQDSAADLAQAQMIQHQLSQTFRFTPWLLLPPVVLAAGIARKVPGIHVMVLSCAVAIFQAVAVQGMQLQQVMIMLYSGVTLNTGSAVVDAICNRGGFVSMSANITMLICSLCLGGVLSRTKVMTILAEQIAPWIRSRFSLVLATLLSCSVVSFFTGAPTVGIVIAENALGEKYDTFRIDRAVLSRTCSDAATFQQPLIPWGASGAFVANCFGLSPMTFAPYFFVGWLMPLIGLMLGLTGIGFPKTAKEPV